jgi:FKBP-type peptidyl-prolyl cis-trans isomerase (trigger factor)
MAAWGQDDPQLQQRRQELRSTVRQQHAIVQAPASQSTPINSQDSAASIPAPRHLSAQERTELRRQLTRDLRAQRSTGSAQQP